MQLTGNNSHDRVDIFYYLEIVQIIIQVQILTQNIWQGVVTKPKSAV
jgi:hypothetical protein